MKNIKKIFVTVMAFLMCCSFLCGCSKSSGYWSKYFDLSDEKIPFYDPWLNIKSDDRFEDAIHVYLKKQLKTINLTVNDFNNSNIASLRYVNFEPDPNRLDDKEYMNNFRQEISLLLTDATNGEVNIIIHEIEKLEFVKKISIIRVEYD